MIYLNTCGRILVSTDIKVAEVEITHRQIGRVFWIGAPTQSNDLVPPTWEKAQYQSYPPCRGHPTSEMAPKWGNPISKYGCVYVSSARRFRQRGARR